MPSPDAALLRLVRRLDSLAHRRDVLRLAAGAVGTASAGSTLATVDAKKKRRKKKKGNKNQNGATTQPPTTQPLTTQPPSGQFVFDRELGSRVDNHPELLSEPGDIATDADGNIYVLEWNQCRIVKFSPNGAFLRQFGSRGSGNGEFEFPDALAIDSGGRMYIADEIETTAGYHYRVQVLKANGDYLATLGAMPTGDYLDEVNSIAVASNGHIFVSGMNSTVTRGIYEWNAAFSYVGRRITLESQQVFDTIAIDGSNRLYAGFVDFEDFPEVCSLRVYSLSNFVEITTFGSTGAGDGQFDRFRGIAADTNGNVYVSDSFNSRLQRLTWNGGFTALAYAGQFAVPGSWEDEFGGTGGVAVGNGSVYLVDQALSCVQKLSPSLNAQSRIGEAGVGQFLGSTPAAADADGNVYVLDNNFVHKLTRQGEAVKRWGGWGSGANQLKFPNAIAINTANEIYVADSGNARIQVYSSNGDLQRTVATAQITAPTGVDFAAEGAYFVTNDDSQEVRIFTNGDAYDRSWNVPGNFYPELAVSSNGRVYVADSSDDEIRIFSSDGTPQGSFSIPGPYGLAVDTSGRLFAASWPNDDSAANIFVRDSNGAPLFTIGTPGIGPGKVSSPSNVLITPSGALLVSDNDNGLMRFVPGADRAAGDSKRAGGQPAEHKQQQRRRKERNHRNRPGGRKQGSSGRRTGSRQR